ncbi:hypothetical protein [Nocardia arizonensis]|uniref:hypothetical protein n=1 Tax=Nocardia arizonensis TaxID=1141647 RepID=UPI000A8BD20D|nr:hypothetical protein [Nocardia arizonensis]
MTETTTSNRPVRQMHRWFGILFTATLVVTMVVLALSGPTWVSYVPLLPLALVAFSGLYILVAYYARRRAATGSAERGAPRARRAHRWSAVAFVVTVLATFVALAPSDPIVWVSYLPLLPLAVSLGTGLYVFALPYRRGSGRKSTGAASLSTP